MNKILIQFMMITPLIMNLSLSLIMLTASNLKNSHPINLLFMLIMYTFIVTLNMNYMQFSWNSFILFLTMIGGLLIMYLYMVSLISNKMFYSKNKNNIIIIMKSFLMFFLLIFLIMIFNEQLNFYFSFNSYSTPAPKNFINLLYNNMFNKSTIFIMFYLYFTLIVIVKISSFNNSPLRKFNNY